MNGPDRLADGALYDRFLRGETSAYDQLMIRHGDSLTRYLYGYLHDWHEAEDLMIEAFARVMVKRPSIQENAFKAYLFRTARNLALRFRERRSRLQFFSVDGMETEIADSLLAAGDGSTSGGSPVEEDLRNDEVKRALFQCLDRIDPELREALWLIYFEEMSYAQTLSSWWAALRPRPLHCRGPSAGKTRRGPKAGNRCRPRCR